MPTASNAMPICSTRTGPRRCDSGAPTPDATNEPTARASRMTPVSSAEYPRTACRNSGRANSSPNSPRLTMRATKLPAPKLRMRNSRRLTTTTLPARRRRSSTRTNATRASTPSRAATKTMETLCDGHSQPPTVKGRSGVSHPYRWPSIRAKTIPTRPRVMSRVPSTSMPLGPPTAFVSGTVTSTPASTMSPIGTLIRKAQCQDAFVVSHPPTSGPRAAMPPIVPPQTANATARDLPVKTALMIDRDAGRIIAPPMPCSARAAMRVAASPDIATSTLAPTKTTTPRTKIRRRPARSEMRPQRMSREAKVRE